MSKLGKTQYKKQLKELNKTPSFRELIKTQNKIFNRKNLSKENLMKLLSETQVLLPLMEKASDWVNDVSIKNLMDCDGYNPNKLTIEKFSKWFIIEQLKIKELENFQSLVDKEKCQQIDILLAKINFLLKEKTDII